MTQKIRKLSAFQRFGVLVAPSAFASVISFIQLSQAVSEKTGAALWWVLGLGFAALAIAQLRIVAKTSN